VGTTNLIQQKRLTRQQIKSWRKAKGLSATQLAGELGYSRGYIKSVEGGSLPITPKFASKFLELDARWNGAEPKDGAPRSSVVTSRYKLPAELTIDARPRRCRECRQWFVFAWANQRTCAGCKHAKRRVRTKQRGSRHGRPSPTLR
jgi:transcriptional regulator with XRE-family HTH domain